MIPSSLISLPYEIWVRIFGILDDYDFLSLTQASKEFRKFFSSSDFVLYHIKRRWFNNPVPGINIEKYPIIDDYFTYFLERLNSEIHVTHQIEEIALNGKSFEGFLKLMEIIMLGDSCGPAIYRLTEQYDDLPLRYYATQYIKARRHAVVYKMIEEYSSRIYSQNDNSLKELPEELMFKLSLMDPGFEKLLPHREKVLNNVVRIVSTECSFISPVNIVEVVERIEQSLLSVISFTQFSENSCLEDDCLLRVYAGEARGSHIINLAILQKLLDRLGIKANLTAQCLAIDFSEDQQVFILLERNRYVVKTKYEIENELDDLGYDLEERRAFFSPLQADEFFDLVLAVSEYEALRQTLPDAYVDGVYPVSNVEAPFACPIMLYFLWKYGYGSSSEKSFDLDPITKRFYELLLDIPFDFCLVSKTRFSDNLKLRENFLNEVTLNLFKDKRKANKSILKKSTLILSAMLQNEILLEEELIRQGDIILYDSRVLYVVQDDTSEKDTTLRVRDCYGDPYFLEIEENTIDSCVRKKNLSKEDLQKFLERPEIGLWFHHYDPAERRFIPNEV